MKEKNKMVKCRDLLARQLSEADQKLSNASGECEVQKWTKIVASYEKTLRIHDANIKFLEKVYGKKYE